MGRDVVKWVGALLAVVGTAAFVYGLITLTSNGSCGCSDDGFCSSVSGSSTRSDSLTG